MPNTRTALIDGDFLLYKIGFGSQKTQYRVFVRGEEEDGHLRVFRLKKDLMAYMNGMGEGLEDWSWDKYIVHDSWGITKYNIEVTLNTILKNCGANKNPIIFFTDEENFRNEVAKILPYKGNRDSSHKPHWFKEIKEYILANYDCRVPYKLEADDSLGIYQMKAESGTTIIYTPDKDLNMIPGYRLTKDDEVIYIDDDSARRSFYGQLIQGDSTDNIPGIYKVANKKFTKKVKEGLAGCDFPEVYDYILELYDGDKDAIEEIGALLYMKRTYEDKVNVTDFDWRYS